MPKKKSATKITHQLTLDEYDELTAENQKLGAMWERRDIKSHLVDVMSQIKGVQELTSQYSLVKGLNDLYDGVNAAYNAIDALPELYDRVGCPDCGAD